MGRRANRPYPGEKKNGSVTARHPSWAGKVSFDRDADIIPKPLQNRTSVRLFVGRASRLPSNNLRPQAGRLRYISKVQMKAEFGISLQRAGFFLRDRCGAVRDLLDSSFAASRDFFRRGLFKSGERV
jgi:hypothetical protein